MDHAYQPVPRADRLCRLCKDEIETPEHALISCKSLDTLVELQALFLVELFENSPDLRTFMHGRKLEYRVLEGHDLPQTQYCTRR